MLPITDLFSDFRQWENIIWASLTDTPWLLFIAGWMALFTLSSIRLLPGKQNDDSGKRMQMLILQAQTAGAVSGMVSGLFYALVPVIVKIWLWGTFAPAIIGLVSGIISLTVRQKATVLNNALLIVAGNFSIEPGKSFSGGILQGLGRLIWEQPQTLIGNAIAHLLNGIWFFEEGFTDSGATFLPGKVPMARGVCYGTFILAENPDKETPEKLAIAGRQSAMHKLLRHEYGHYLQSRQSGWLYLFKYGIPSAAKLQWPETDAEFRSDRYLLIRYGLTPVFKSYGKEYRKVNPAWWELALIISAPLLGTLWGGAAVGLGAWLTAAGIISAMNFRKKKRLPFGGNLFTESVD